MKKLIISISIISAVFSAQAQSGYDAVLQKIEENSTTLSALREQMEAQKLGARTGIFPANPEVEFNYLWGNPNSIGNRTDFAVHQSFDFPTAYAHRSRIADLQSVNAELAYKAERINVLLTAKQVCIELAYFNALASEYAARLQNAERIAAAFKIRFDAGEISVLENNRAQMNVVTVQTEISLIEAERASLLSELRRLNGGNEFSIFNFQFSISELPNDFEDWYASVEANSPVLQYVSSQIEIHRQQVRLNQALGLPRFSAGYMSETVVGEQFRGVSFGVSVPLWENKNRVREAQAQVRVSEMALEDSKLQFYNRLQSVHLKASTLQQNAINLRQSLTTYGNEPLLKRALDAGEISLLNYLLETEYYYDAMNRVLEAERDFELAAAELWAVEL